MHYKSGIFIQLLMSVYAENPYRDRIKITSCENEINKNPVMTFVVPEDFIPINEHHEYERKGDFLEKVVGESQLKMLTNDECKLKT